MNTEDSHPDAGMDLMFCQRRQGPVPLRERYPIGISNKREERAEMTGTVIGALIVVAICFGAPSLLHFLFRL